jgi:hypothetical protein
VTHAESTVPDELRNNTEGAGDTEEDSVEVLVVETVAAGCQRVSYRMTESGVHVLGEEDTGVSVDVGPGVCAEGQYREAKGYEAWEDRATEENDDDVLLALPASRRMSGTIL